MYGMMIRSGHRGQFTKGNSKKWLWKTYYELIYYVRAGCNKPRFQMLALANLDAGGDLVALEKYSKHVVAIRAMGGHSNLSVNPEEMGRVENHARNISKTVSRDILEIHRLHLRLRVKTRRPRPQRPTGSLLQL